MDCSYAEGNKGCGGGAMDQAFEYVIANGGLDGEAEYGYMGSDDELCWTAAEERHLASMTNFTDVPPSDEAALIAAIATTPVSVAIEADQPAFQHYRSGVFDNATCGTTLDHGVLAVGYTRDAYIVKNSWGGGWGEAGFIRMKRGVGKDGLCGISLMASYPTVNASTPTPVPPPTPGSRPSLPCNCTASCAGMCQAFGMTCCDGTGGNCACMPASSCPQCSVHPPDGPYARCADNSNCAAGSECVTVTGVPGQVCMPSCAGYGSSCPAPTAKEATSARPYCDACITGRGRRAVSRAAPRLPAAEAPNACILVCNATKAGQANFERAECPIGATCKPLSLDSDPCDDGERWPAGAHPCQEGGTCGICTFP
jgi:KDEL-tailed cysteine endopeptidase